MWLLPQNSYTLNRLNISVILLKRRSLHLSKSHCANLNKEKKGKN